MKIIFFGSDEFSISALRACVNSGNEVSLIITTPPQKKGRGLKYSESPVQIFATEKKMPFITPATLNGNEVLDALSDINPDFYVVSSYGKYIPSKYLAIPKVATLNVHPSLIPKYRGSGPIQWALLNGDLETGVSIIEVAKKLDGGDIFVQKRIPIDQFDDHLSLRAKLGHLSYDILTDMFKKGISKESLKRTRQDESLATYAPKLDKANGHIKLTDDGASIEQKVRALKPWPGTFMICDGQRVSLLDVTFHPEHNFEPPGTVIEITPDESLIVATTNSTLRIKRVQPAGKNEMTAAAYANGKRIKPGYVFVTE